MKALRFACAAACTFAVVAAAACYDFGADYDACVSSGRCEPPGSGGDGGEADGGADDGGDAGELPDAGDAGADGGDLVGVPIPPDGPIGSCGPDSYVLNAPVCVYGWCWESPLPTGEALRTVTGRDGSVWIAGEKGTVLRLDNDCELTPLARRSEGTVSEAVASGNGVLFASDDLGIVRWHDGGWSLAVSEKDVWTALEVDPDDIPFAGATTGELCRYPAGDIRVCGTLTPLDAGVADLARGAKVWALSPAGQLFEGGSSILTTTAWSPVTISATAQLRSVFSRGDELWLAGDNGQVVVRPDAGQFTVTHTLKTADMTLVNLHAVVGNSTNKTWIMGEAGAIWRYLGNNAFEPVAVAGSTPLVRGSLHDGWIPETGRGYVVGGGGAILVEENNLWKDVRTTFGPTADEELNAVDGFRDVVWAAGRSGRLYCRRDHRWADCGGGSQSKEMSISTLAALGEDQVLVGGPAGLLAEVTNGGNTWSASGFTQLDGGLMEPGGDFHVRGIFSPGGAEAWAVGQYGVGGGFILQRSNGVWQEHPAGAGRPALYGVDGLGGGDVWVVGDDGTILHLLAGQDPLDFSMQQDPRRLRGVHVDPEDGSAYIAGNETILGLSPSGEERPPLLLAPMVTGSNFYDTVKLPGGDFIAVGDQGLIYRWTQDFNDPAAPAPQPTRNRLKGAWKDPVSGQVWLVGDNSTVMRFTPTK